VAKVSGGTVYPLEFGSAPIWTYGYIRVVRRLAASVLDLAVPLGRPLQVDDGEFDPPVRLILLALELRNDARAAPALHP